MFGLLRCFYRVFCFFVNPTRIHSEGGLKTCVMRQWLGHGTSFHPTLGPRSLSHRGGINGLFCPLASSGIQPMEDSNQRKALRAEKE